MDAGPAVDLSYDLLAQEVPNFDLEGIGVLVLLDVDVDGEMGVDVAHLVLEALGDADDQVVLPPVSHCPWLCHLFFRCGYATYDESADSAESRDALAVAVVQLNLDERRLGLREADRQVTERLAELALRIVRRSMG